MLDHTNPEIVRLCIEVYATFIDIPERTENLAKLRALTGFEGDDKALMAEAVKTAAAAFGSPPGAETVQKPTPLES